MTGSVPKMWISRAPPCVENLPIYTLHGTFLELKIVLLHRRLFLYKKNNTTTNKKTVPYLSKIYDHF